MEGGQDRSSSSGDDEYLGALGFGKAGETVERHSDVQTEVICKEASSYSGEISSEEIVEMVCLLRRR